MHGRRWTRKSGTLKAGPSNPVSIQWLPLVWSPDPWATLRTTAILSAIRACRGISSPNWRPGTLVRLAPNGPRTCGTASGFGSQVSWCPGPPLIQNRMTAESGAAPLAWARTRNRSGSVSPPTPSRPAWTKERRVRPRSPYTRNMRQDSEAQTGGRGNLAGCGYFNRFRRVGHAECQPGAAGKSTTVSDRWVPTHLPLPPLYFHWRTTFTRRPDGAAGGV